METTTIEQLRDKCLQWLAAFAGDGAKLDAAEARIRELFDAHISQAAERGLCERNPAPDAAAACVPSSATTVWPSGSDKPAERGEAVAWFYRDPRTPETMRSLTDKKPGNGYVVTPLYTAPPPAAGVPDDLKRYRFELMGTASHWGLVPIECEGGEWCKFEDVRRIEFLCRLSATPSPEADHG